MNKTCSCFLIFGIKNDKFTAKSSVTLTNNPLKNNWFEKEKKKFSNAKSVSNFLSVSFIMYRDFIHLKKNTGKEQIFCMKPQVFFPNPGKKSAI